MNFSKFIGASALALSLIAPAMPASAETWKPAGTGRLRDDLMTYWYSFDEYYEFDVEIEESVETPGRYRLVNAYKNFPATLMEIPENFKDFTNYLIVDASDPQHVYIDKGLAGILMGYDYETTVPQFLNVWSIAADYYTNRFGDFVKADEEGVCGKMVDGIISFPRYSILVTPYDAPLDPAERWNGEVPEDGPQVGFSTANSKGMFRLKLNGAPNVDMTCAAPTLSADNKNIQYQLSFESDVEYALAAMIEGNAIAGVAEKIASGAIQSVRVEKDGKLSLPYTADGQVSLIVVPYYNGHAHKALEYIHELTFFPDWKSIGTAEFTETILGECEMSKSFYLKPYTYTVEAEVCISKPHLVRIVDPYKDAYPYSYRTECDYTRQHNLVFDISDPDCVLMKHTDNGVGFQIGSYGTIEAWSRADRDITLRGKTKADVKALGLGGTLKDNVLTFPKETLLVRWPLIRPAKPDGSDYYWANLQGNFCLKFAKDADLSSVESIAAPEAAGTPRYFNLQGVEVSNPGGGIFIRVCNGVSTKIYID